MTVLGPSLDRPCFGGGGDPRPRAERWGDQQLPDVPGPGIAAQGALGSGKAILQLSREWMGTGVAGINKSYQLYDL